jgi:pimeloyl-ACP methyl ester carboxylesterase
MAKRIPRAAADYIVPLDINGLEGRMLYLPGSKSKQDKEILFIYGHHSSLERWWGLIQVINRYGTVTAPDLPGFGGMDSFYKLGRKPSIDSMADYLASFIKLRFRRKKLAIAAMSFGFVVVTRMLQKYPELTKKVTLLVSIVGFAHHEDFTFSRKRHKAYLFGTKVLSHRVPAGVFRHVALHPKVLRTFYARTHNAKHKFAEAKDNDDLQRLLEVEIGLWHDNDVQTWAYTTTDILTFNNCTQRVNVPVWHVASSTDHFFDNHLVKQHMRTIYKEFHPLFIDLGSHAPSVIADEKMAAPLMPPALQRVLRKL